MLFQTNKLQRGESSYTMVHSMAVVWCCLLIATIAGLSAVFIATATVAVLLVSVIPSVDGQGTQVANCYRTVDCTGANKPVYLESEHATPSLP